MVFFPFLAAMVWLELSFLAIAMLIILIAVASEHAKLATWVVAFIVTISFFSKGFVWQLFWGISWNTGLVAVIYLGIGLIWSFAHWYWYVKSLVEEGYKKGNRINPRENVGHIVSWIFYWPFDLVYTFLNEPLRRFGLFCVRSLSGVYDGISNMIIRKLVKIPED
jgi:hypothetical protein